MNGECEHVLALRAYLRENGIRVYSEDGEEPAGWVNIHCTKCNVIYEDTLNRPEPEDYE